MDGGGANQKQVFRQKNLPLNSVHGRTLFNSAMDGGGIIQKQVFRQKNLPLNSVYGRTLFNSAIHGGNEQNSRSKM